jgi:hypothetical protein
LSPIPSQRSSMPPLRVPAWQSALSYTVPREHIELSQLEERENDRFQAKQSLDEAEQQEKRKRAKSNMLVHFYEEHGNGQVIRIGVTCVPLRASVEQERPLAWQRLAPTPTGDIGYGYGYGKELGQGLGQGLLPSHTDMSVYGRRFSATVLAAASDRRESTATFRDDSMGAAPVDVADRQWFQVFESETEAFDTHPPPNTLGSRIDSGVRVVVREHHIYFAKLIFVRRTSRVAFVRLCSIHVCLLDCYFCVLSGLHDTHERPAQNRATYVSGRSVCASRRFVAHRSIAPGIVVCVCSRCDGGHRNICCANDNGVCHVSFSNRQPGCHLFSCCVCPHACTFGQKVALSAVQFQSASHVQ